MNTKHSFVKKLTALVLCLCMVLPMVTTGFAPMMALLSTLAPQAEAAVTEKGKVAFYVPEVIYLYPEALSSAQATATPFQYYVENTVNTSSIYTQPTTNTALNSTGTLYFAAESGFSDVSIATRFCDANGNTISGGSVTTGAFSNKTSYGTFAVTAGTSPSLAASTTGCWLEWTVTYTNGAGERQSAIAYSYVYKPYIYAVGASAGAGTGTDGGANWAYHATWISGIHSITAVSTSQGNSFDKSWFNRYTKENFSSFISKDKVGYVNGTRYESGSQAKITSNFTTDPSSTGGSLGYAVFANTSSTGHYLEIKGNSSPEYFLSSTAGTYTPESGKYNFNGAEYRGNKKDIQAAVYSKSYGNLYIDTSRYTNLNQIPNLGVGMMVHSDSNSDGGTGNWYIADFTGRGTGYFNKWYEGGENRDTLYNDHGSFIAAQSTGSLSLNYDETEGIRYVGAWPKALTGTLDELGATAVYRVKGFYSNRDTNVWGNYDAQGHTLVEMKATYYNKATLRTAVNNAVNAMATLGLKDNYGSYYYDTNSTAWTAFKTAYRNACVGLTKLDGSCDVSGLATALNNAVTALKNGQSRKIIFNVNYGGINPNYYILGNVTDGGAGLTVSYGSDESITLNGTISGSNAFGTTPFTPKVGTYTFSSTLLSGSKTGDGCVVLDSGDENGSNVSSRTNFDFTGSAVSNKTYSLATAKETDLLRFWQWKNTQNDVYSNLKVRIKVEKGSTKTAYSPAARIATTSGTYGTLPTPDERPGYTFKGWATTADGTTVVSSDTAVTVDTLYAIWEPNKYNVTFDNLIDLSKWNTTTASNATFSNVTDTGFTLTSNAGVGEGTTTSPFFTVEPGKSYKIDIDFTGDAWDVYIFFCDANGNWIDFADGATNRYSSNGSTGVDKDNAVFTAPNKSEVVKAQIRLDANGASNTVTFSNIRVYENTGVSVSPVNKVVTYDSTYGTLPTPTKTGYTFNQWEDANGTAYSSTNTVKITDTLALYSDWTPNTYTIYLEGNNHSSGSTEQPMTMTYDVAKNLSKNGYTKVGYTFAGWNTAADGSGTAYADEQSVKNLTAVKNGAVSLYAQWTPNTYTLSFDLNYTDAPAGPDSKTATYDAPVGELPTPTREGYTFAGWYAEKACTNKVTAETKYTVADNITVYAAWTGNEQVLTINTAGGVNTGNLVHNPDGKTSLTGGSDAELSYNVSFDENGAVDIYGNYTGGVGERTEKLDLWVYLEAGKAYEYSFTSTNNFSEFYLLPNGETTNFASLNRKTATNVYGGEFVCGGVGDVGDNHWIGVATATGWYQIRLDQDCGADSAAVVTAYTISDFVIKEVTPDAENRYKHPTGSTMEIYAPVKGGYTFNGWTASGNGSLDGTTYTFGPGAGTLTANWTANNYTLTLDADGGTITGDTSIPYTADSTYTLPEPTKAGYEFVRWYVESTNGNWPTDATSILTSGDAITGFYGDTTLKAVWAPLVVDYKVEHYQMDLGGETYTLYETENKRGETDTDAVFADKTYEGFTYSEAKVNDTVVTSATIAGDGQLVIKLYYTRNKYKVTTSVNNDKAFASVNGAGEYFYGANVTLTANVKTGYTFINWTKDGTTEANTSTSFSFTMGAEKVEWTANASAQTVNYTVIHEYETLTGGVYEADPALTFSAEVDTQVTPAFANKDGFTAPAETQTVTVKGDGTTVVTYRYTRNSYDFTVEIDGVATTTQYKYEQAVTAPADPTKAGYTFAGWEGTVPATMPADDVTVKATWTINKYTVTYKVNGEVVNTETYDYDESIAPYTYTKTGYSISAWTGESHTVMPAKNLEYTATATPINYDITYDLAGGKYPENNNPNPTKYNVESDDITLDSTGLTKQGYTFAGWTGTGLSGATTTVEIAKGSTGNRSYTATWTPAQNTYTIETYTMDTAGNYGTAVKTTGSGLTGDTATVTPEAKTGFTEDASSVLSGTIAADGSLVLKVYYKRNQFTLTVTAGTGVSTVAGGGTYYYGATLNMTADLKDGYKTLVWSDGTNTYIPGTSTMPDKALTLTATATAEDYTITYDLAGGTVAGTNPSGYNVETDSFTLINPTKNGYEFLGWTGTGLDAASKSVTVEKGSTGERTYTATWKPVTYNISYSYDGGSVATENPYSYTIESDPITLNTPTKTGYAFAGWEGTDIEGKAESVTIATGSTGHRTYTATWTESDANYTVNFYQEDLNADTFTKVDTKTVPSTTNKVITATTDKVDYDGFTYANAKLNDGSVVTEFTVAADGSSVINLYYTRNSYKLTFNYTSGIVGDVIYEQTTVEYGDSISAPTTNPTRAGYTFTEWDATVPATMPANDVTITATWSPNVFDITYVLDGGVIAADAPKTHTFDTTTTIPDPTKTGYTFAGWMCGEKELGKALTVEEKDFYDDFTLTATWTPNATTYTVETYIMGVDGTYADTATFSEKKDTVTDKEITAAHETMTGFSADNDKSIVKIDHAAHDGSSVLKLYYSRNKMALTLETGAGIASVTGAGEYYYQASVTIDASLATGYDWAKWTNGDADFEIAKNHTFPMPAEALTLKANASIHTYNINIDLADGAFAADYTAPKNYQVTDEDIVIPDPTRTGYTFNGWLVNGSATPQAGYTIDTALAVDVSLVASWTPVSYTITYHGVENATNNNPTTFTIVTDTFTLTDPTRTGYEFLGWTYGDVTVPTKNVTIKKGSIDNREFTANWKALGVEYNIIYRFEGFTEDSYDSFKNGKGSANAESDVTVADIAIAYDGFTFNDEKTVDSFKNGTTDGKVTVELYYTRNSYTITYETVGGTEIAEATYKYDADVTAPADPTKTGYTFGGWDKEIPAKMPAENVTITAKWDINKYTITFANTGDSTIDPITQDYNTAVTAPEDPEKTGYTFTGWDKEIPATMPAEDLTISATWKINQYTVTFDTDGGSEIAPITQDYATTITKPADPTRTGYTFAGWDKEIPATMPAENITVKALWTINEYTITFDTDGGSAVEAITQNYNTDVTAPANPTKTGYTFKGWDKKIPATMPAENVTLKAQWQINQYTITFDTDGGSAVTSITQDYNSTVTAPTDPTKAGYDFKGWTPALPTTMPAENTTVKATWEIVTYNISYELNGGTNHADNPKTYTVLQEVKLEAPTKVGYTFKEWSDNGTIGVGTTGNKTFTATWTPNTDTEFTVEYYMQPVDGSTELSAYTKLDTVDTMTGTSDTNVDVTPKNFDGFTAPAKQTVYVNADGSAVVKFYYTRNTYTITFNTDGGSEVGIITALYEAPVTAPSAPTKTGYTFDGWDKTVPEKMPLNGDTIKATWKANVYDVTYDYNVPEGVTVTHTGNVPSAHTYDTASPVSDPERVGYTFAGWIVNGTGTAQKNLTLSATGYTAAITLQATWTANEQTYRIDYYYQDVNDPNSYNYAGATDSVTKTAKTGDTVTAEILVKEGFVYNADKSFITDVIPPEGEVILKVYYDRQKFTVTWDVDGVQTTETYCFGQNISKPADPTKVGYNFAGWSPAVPATMPAENKTFTAVFTADDDTVYTVVHKLEDLNADTYTEKETEIKYGTTATVVTPAVNTYEGFSVPQTQTVTIAADGSTKVVYLYTRNSYKVTVVATDAGLSTPTETQTLEYGDTLNVSVTVANGYKFLGWTSDNEKVNGSEAAAYTITVPASNVTLTAKAEIIKYTIGYKLNDGALADGVTNPTEYDVTTEDFTLNKPEKRGYTFKGWTGSNGNDAQTTVTVAKGTFGNLEYTANWTINQYKITYDLAGGSETTANPNYYTVTSGNITLHAPKKVGYTFTGWTGTDLDGKVMDVTIPTNSIGERKYTATWEANTQKYYVDLYVMDTNGAYPESLKEHSEFTAKTGESVTFTMIEREGFTIKDSAVLSGNIPVTDSEADALVLKGYYIRDQHTVTLTKGTGIDSVSGDDTYYYGEEITVNAVVSKGYTWKNWTAGETIKSAEQAYTITIGTADIALTANATLNTYTIRYSGLDQYTTVEENPTSYNVHSEEITLNNPVKDGYTFTGWTGTDLAGNTMEVKIEKGSVGDREYVANWNIITYTLTYDLAEGTLAEGESIPATYNVETKVTLPTPTRVGYTFAGWSDGTNTAISVVLDGEIGDRHYTATWTANSNTKYTVNHYQMNLDGTYNETATATVVFSDGVSDGSVTPAVNAYEGFTSPDAQTVKVEPDGSTVVKYYYVRNQYTLTYVIAGSADVVNTYYYGATLPEAPTATRDGYTFSGWNAEIPAKMPAHDVEITALWNTVAYTVSFNANGGNEMAATEYNVETAVTLPKAERTGYDFAGWTVTKTQGNWADTIAENNAVLEAGLWGNVTLTANWTARQDTKYVVKHMFMSVDGQSFVEDESERVEATGTSDSKVTPAVLSVTGFTSPAAQEITIAADGSTILEYKYKRNQYTLTWKIKGSADETLTYYYDAPVTAKADPVLPGHTFTSWSRDIPATMPAEHIEILANFAIITYTITYNYNGGTVAAENKTAYTVETPDFTLTNPTKAGYTFTGWTGTDNGMSITVKQGSTGARSYTATWDADEQEWYVDVYYMDIYGKYADTPDTTLTFKADTDTPVSYDLAASLKEGFTADAANSVVGETKVLPNNGLRLIAKYTRNQHTFTFDSAGGTAVADITAFYDVAITKPADPTRTGYTFNGWSQTVPDKMPDTDMHFIATWNADEYVLTLDENGGTAVEDITYTIESTDVLPTISRAGYFFEGWKVITAGGAWALADANYAAGTALKGKYGSAALSAQWTTVQYTLEFNTTHGTVDPASISYTVEDTSNVLPTPVRPGYTFTGWKVTEVSDNTQSAGYIYWEVGKTYAAGTKLTDTYGNAKFEAQWQKNTYNVTANAANITFAGATTATVDVDYTATLTPHAGYTLPDSITVTVGGNEIFVGTGYTYTVNADGTATLEIDGAYIIGDVEIKVVREIITYTISYDYANATVKPANPTTYDVETATIDLIAPERTGYTFLGWTGSNGTTPETKVTIPVGTTGDKNYVANWQADPRAYTVEIYYMTTDGTYNSTPDKSWTVDSVTDAQVSYNINDPETLLTGFSANESISTLTGTVPATGALTLVAKYDRNKYALTVNGCEGITAATGTVEYFYDKEIVVDATVAMGYTWVEWQSANATVLAGSTDKKYVFNMPAADATLTAVATLDTYAISYDLANGTLAEGESNPASYTVTTDTFTLVNPTRTGYDFVGWTGTDLAAPTKTVTIANNSTTGDKSYTANWKAIEYTVTYNLAGGTAQGSNHTVYTIETAAQVLTAPVKTGYTFTGWTGSNGTTPDKNVTIAGGNIGDLSFTANWSADAHTYTVEYRTMTTEGVYAEKADKIETIDSYTDAKVTVNVTPDKGFYIADSSILSGTVTHDDKLVLKVYIGREQYNVNLIDGGDGIASVNTNTTLVYFDAPVEVHAVVETGYTFEEWTSAEEGVLAGSESNPYAFNMPAGDVTLTATATLNEYTINYVMNGGTNNTANPDTYTVLDSVTVKQPTRLGYTFTDWTGSYNGKNVYIPAGSTGNITLTANWSINTYTVTYNLDGGSVDGTNPETYTVHDSFTLINPTKVGYDFAGWTGSVAGENVTIPENTTGNLTFTANWTARTDTKYTVNFYIESVNGDNTYILSDDGYVKEYTSDKEITVGAPVRTGFTTPVAQTKKNAADGTTVFNFYYERNVYTYTYKAIGYEDAVYNYYYEHPIAKHADPVRTGYTFEGWNPTVVSVMPAHDVVSVAQWKAVTYTIGYELNDGTDGGNPTSYTIENGYTLKNPTRVGYDFVGWTGTDLDEMTMLVTVTAGATGNRSYTANWQPTVYTISYDLDGGTDGGVNPISYTIEDTVTLVNPTKPGYRFSGWTGTGIYNTSQYVSFSKGTGNRAYTARWIVANDTPYTVEHYQQDIGSNTYTLFETDNLTGTTLTNIAPKVKTYPGFTSPATKTDIINADGTTVVKYYYTRNNYTIYFNSNGGTDVASQTYAFGQTVVAPPAPSFSGYSFAGWTPALPETMTAGNLYVTASWQANTDTPYTVYHYYQDVDCISYPDELMVTEYCHGETGATVEVATRDMEGFTSPAKRSIVIAADGSRTVRYYYTRNTYTVTFVDHNDNILDLQSVVYGLPATPPALEDRAPDADGHYTFIGWSEDVSFIHGYTTIKAMYEVEAHDPGEEADCTNALICTVCGYEIAPANGHMPVVQTPAVEPTCTTGGNTADSVCSVCGEVLSRYQKLPALGHEIGSWYVDVPATDTETGVLKRVCSRCDWFETYEIPVLSDTPVVSIDITTAGSQAYVGTTYQLVTNIKPANAGNKQVIWESSDPSIASVTADGYIVSHKPGEVTFTVTTLDGLKTDSITINFYYSADYYTLLVVDLFACNISLDGMLIEDAMGKAIRVKAGSTLAFTIDPTTQAYLDQGGYIFTANGSNVAPDANGVYYIYNVHENIEITALPAIGKPEFDDDQQYDTDEVPEKSIFAKLIAFFERIAEWFRNLFK